MQVRAENLTMQFNDAGRIIEIFRNLSLNVPAGQSLAIVGESGVGKTTLLYLLAGLETPTSGEVFLGEHPITELTRNGKDVAPIRGKNVGFVFQLHHLLPEFDALENVMMPLLIQARPRAEAQKWASELLEKVGLKERLHHRPGMLSGGEQQRVAIARALSARPGVLLADEPTGNLDQRTGGDVQELLIGLAKEFGSTLIVVTHSMELAAKLERTVEITTTGLKERERSVGMLH